MKLGTIVTCNQNIKWIVFYNQNDTFYWAMDFASQSFKVILPKDSIINSEENNIEWLFIKKREKNNKDIAQYL